MSNSVEARMRELMIPVDQHIFSLEDQQDQLMLACAMMQRVKEILDFQLGEEGRIKMFKSYTE